MSERISKSPGRILTHNLSFMNTSMEEKLKKARTKGEIEVRGNKIYSVVGVEGYADCVTGEIGAFTDGGERKKGTIRFTFLMNYEGPSFSRRYISDVIYPASVRVDPFVDDMLRESIRSWNEQEDTRYTQGIIGGQTGATHGKIGGVVPDVDTEKEQ